MRRLKENKYFHFGAMLLGVVTVSIFLLAVVLNLEAVGGILSTIGDVFSPLIIGVVLAYLMNPLMNFLDRRLLPILLKRNVNEEKAKKFSRTCGLIFAVLVSLLFVYEFCSLLLPQLYESIRGIVDNFSTYYARAESWIMNFLADNPTIQTYAAGIMEDLYSVLMNFVTNGLLPNIETIITSLTSSVMSVVGAAFDLLIGLCAAIYMLASRDLFLAQSKKIVVALCKGPTADNVLRLGRRIHKVFSGFIIGKILDSLIIGVLCYFGMLVLKLPHPALIATVVGVTNVIPFFGPFIGAIPSAFLILLVNPLQAVYFGLFILGLQQLDGNVIGPRILGDTIGISGFWVLVSITVAGGLFGFTGMLLGVPVFAVLYMLVTEFVNSKLHAKGKTTDTNVYQTIKSVGDLDDAASTDE
ncbi:MAG: AI-2E family transporter [Clostridia bacterium]|nr:AI-2E family transporter [Clostridia bacterium]